MGRRSDTLALGTSDVQTQHCSLALNFVKHLVHEKQKHTFRNVFVKLQYMLERLQGLSLR